MDPVKPITFGSDRSGMRWGRSVGPALALSLVATFPFLAPLADCHAESVSPPAARPGGDSSQRYRPSAEYEVRHLAGWKIYIAPDLLEDAELARRVFAELERQLKEICRVVPEDALRKIQTVPIWVEKYEGHHPCMAYHPSRAWLLEHDINPDKAKCVEIAGARNFVSWTKAQPWMVLHELAHAYHDRFLPGGYANREIRERFETVSKGELYQEVLHVNGRKQRAYALKDPMEFFAETSEAFFGKNDFYPFTREELESYDPATYALLAKLWGVTLPDKSDDSQDRVATEAQSEHTQAERSVGTSGRTP